MENSPQIWMIKLLDNQEINDIVIPTLAEASWKLEGKLYPYACFKVREIEYNKTSRF